MNLDFTSEIRSRQDLFSTLMALKTYSGLKNVFNSKWKFEKLAEVVRIPQTTQNLVILRSCFTAGDKDGKTYNARAQLLFFSLNRFFGGGLVPLSL